MCKRLLASTTLGAFLLLFVATGQVWAALPENASLPQSGSITARHLLDEASGTRADSVGVNTLADNATVLSSTGINENNASSPLAAQFVRGQSEYLSIADNASFSPTSDLSFGIWMYADSVLSEGAIHSMMGKTAGGSDRSHYFGLWNDTGVPKIVFANSANGSSDTLSATAWSPSTATWYLVGFSYDSSDSEVQFFIDGQPQGVAVAANASLFNNSSDYQIGTNISNYWDGRLQDAIYWKDTELTAQEWSDYYDLYTAGGGASGSPKQLIWFGYVPFLPKFA